jgi:hypothetical protein
MGTRERDMSNIAPSSSKVQIMRKITVSGQIEDARREFEKSSSKSQGSPRRIATTDKESTLS